VFLVLGIEALFQFGNSHRFGHFLYDNLDENSGRRRRLVFVQMDVIHDAPGHRIRVQEMREEFRNISQFDCLQSMNRIVLLRKALHKCILPSIVHQTEARCDQPVVPQKRSFLGTTFDQHVDEFRFPTRRDIDSSEFVSAFFKGCTRHDRQVDCSSQMDKVGLGQVFYDRDLFVSMIRRNDQCIFTQHGCFLLTIIVGRVTLVIAVAIVTVIVTAVP
jgi:hypothetical protein